MTEENKIAKATETYETVCKMLDNRKWRYTRHDDDLTITCTAQGEDLPMDLIIVVNPKRQTVALYSPMPYDIPEDKTVDMAMAICAANYGLAHGYFEFDILKGNISYKVSTSFFDSTLSESLFEFMLLLSMNVIDDYNDQFLMVSKGILPLEKFIESQYAE